MRLTHLALTLILSLSPSLFANSPKVELGSALPEVNLDGDHGGLVADGSSWNSKTLKGKVQFVVYVDPDEHALNDELIDRMEAEKFPRTHFGSAALINLAASWKPNSLIMPILRGKQKRFPATVYVFDKDQSIAKQWGFPLEGYTVLLLDSDSKLLFSKTGKLEKSEIDTFVQLIRIRLDTLAKADEENGQEKKKSL